MCNTSQSLNLSIKNALKTNREERVYHCACVITEYQSVVGYRSLLCFTEFHDSVARVISVLMC